MSSKTLVLAAMLVLAACSHLQANSSSEYTLPDGSVYSGKLQKGLMSGRGTLTWLNGDTYTGEFSAGVIDGQGELTLESGEVFRGTFTNGLLNGAGQWLGPDDVTYTGEFKNDVFHGDGVYASAEGAYAGEFVNGELTGLGTYTDKKGVEYAGEFKSWRFEGHGIWDDGKTRYTGEFKSGVFHGYGERIDIASGKVEQAGKWRWGSFVGKPLSAAERRAQNIALEQAVFSQTQKLQQSIAALAPSKSGEVDLFALIGAGDGTQNVFYLEAQTIAEKLHKKNIRNDHIALFSNHADTSAQLPLLTRANLQTMIAELAKKMQPEDILLLYLTSHGSAKHEFSLEAPGYDFVDLTPDDLAATLSPLAENPKVLMISACYSGGFVDALKAPNHLVMTAAREDRTSFGCGDADTMTYFGRAYFETALPEAEGFVQAFERAKKTIESWEAEEEFEHSEPQIFVGDKIDAVLDAYWLNRIAQ